jgi:hypothetical protein
MTDKLACCLLLPRFAARFQLLQLVVLVQNCPFKRCFGRKP